MRRPWFDEAFADDGSRRPPYAALEQHLGWDPLRPEPAVAEALTERPLGDDARILPVPLVLDAAELDLLRAGVAQRARTLQRLFAAIVAGDAPALARAGLDAADLDAVLAADGWSAATLRRTWAGRDRADIRFVYGPDLVRDRDGRWRVLEDNVGCIGGTADGFHVTACYRAATGLSGRDGCTGEPDLAVAVRRLRGVRDGDAVAVQGCDAAGPGSPWLDEAGRRRDVLDRLGVPVIAPGDLDPASDGVTVVNFDDGAWATASFAESAVTMLNAPGTGMLGDKALLAVVDRAVRTFAGEDPVLTAPPTRRFDGDDLLHLDDRRLDDWVVKSSAGRQGSEVHVLRWLGPRRREVVAELVRSRWHHRAVAQRYVEPSRLAPAGAAGWASFRVELRPVAYVVGWQDVHVARHPVGKAVSSLDVRRLNNLSQGACYVPVLGWPCPDCSGTPRRGER